ncbi:S1 family peptidase [Xenorhabdus khoisanae]|uniref:S1 family peptidase n=1 Tax=Xenorhabdus khoisanae TaxID=880157 RepID=UPI0032B7DFFF
MFIIRLIPILFFLIYCGASFSDVALKSTPLETIIGGEKSCEPDNNVKCKPWVVSIFHKNTTGELNFICSGSLISEKYVLTAAHCEMNAQKTKEYIIKNYKEKEIGTASRYSFFKYTPDDNRYNDFAIIRLEKPIIEERYGRVRRFFNYDGAYEKLDSNYYQASIYGYGVKGIDENTGKQQANNGTQYRADVKILTSVSDANGKQVIIIEANKNKGLSPGISQPGDSGGPIFWDDTIIGVNSFGDEMAKGRNGENNYLPVLVSDVTDKHSDSSLRLIKWFSSTMQHIWIYTPDWNANLRKRDEDIIIKGFGKASSKIQLVYSIDDILQGSVECKVNNSLEWKCTIPRESFFKDLDETRNYEVTISASETSDSSPKSETWTKDTVQAKIPSVAKEFGIIYPVDGLTIYTEDIWLRGYAEPSSEVQVILQVNSNGYGYKGKELCQEIRKNEPIKTNEYGKWLCTVRTELIQEIKEELEEENIGIRITANQNTKDVNLYDQVNISLSKNKTVTAIELSLKEKNPIHKYKKLLDLDVSHDENANRVCVFKRGNVNCQDNRVNSRGFYLLNSSGGTEDSTFWLFDIEVDAIQKVEGVDPLDNKTLRTEKSFIGRYFKPTFINKYSNDSPDEIISTELKNKKISGYGGDNEEYTLPNKDEVLPSEYSICMKKEDNSPPVSEASKCKGKDEKEIYIKIPLENGEYSDEIPIEYKTYSGKNNFPTWDILLPSSLKLKDGLYYIEVADKYHPVGLNNIKNNWMRLLPERSYFRIKTPEVKINTPSEGETDTVGSTSFLSGSSNVPGDEVAIKRRKIAPSLALEKNNQNLSNETVICTGAVVSDNGNWQCGKPIIFPAGTYELTAELIKEGKVVATDVTHITIKDKNDDDEPEQKKFEINNPKNNSTVDPDNPINFSGTFSGPAGGGSGGGGFGGFLSSLIGGFFAALGEAGQLLSGALGFFWEFTIHPGDIFGGDTYVMTLQETQNGVNVGEPIKWNFTVPMRITEPETDAQYRLNDGISVKGQGSPGQLVFVAGSEYLLPLEKVTFPISSSGLICTATVDEKGKWTCPDNPILTAINEGKFFLYAAQYKKTGSAQLGELGDTYERTSQVRRKYEVTKSKIQIKNPVHGAKITKLPFTISGTGEKDAQVYIEGFGGADNCNTTVDASSGQWSCGPYQPEDGKYTLSADQFISDQLNSTSQISFEVQTKTIKPVVITQPHNGGLYRHLENILPRGTGEPGTTVCLAEKVLSQICKNGVTVDEQGNWEWLDGLDTAVKGEQKLVATAFLDKVRQSTAKVTFKIEPAAGETMLTVETPKEDEVIKTPSYTFSGTMPSNAKTVTVQAFGGNDDCVAQFNEEDYTWTCGPYSSVPGDYDVAVIDDAGSQINRSFKVRYGDNLQMSIRNPTEGEQIDKSSYWISGKGQVGARVTVNGAVTCDVLVNENQDWVCPYNYKSIPGTHKLLGQQWVNGVPSGKPVTRNYEVIYGVRDIAVLTPTEGEKITTKTYEISGKGQVGARVTISSSGKKICDVLVDEQQNWSCPTVQSVLGAYQFLAQQWVDGTPSVKSITRNYEVLYGVQDIKIDITADAFCLDQNSYSPTSAFVMGTATKGAYVSLKVESDGGHSSTCTTQTSQTDGSWSCRVDDIGLGGHNLIAAQSLTPNGHSISPIVNQKVNITYNKDFRITEPLNRDNYETTSWVSHSGWVYVSGTGTPESKVLIEVVESSSGNKKTTKVNVGKKGKWNYGEPFFGGFLLNIGNYTLNASSQSCGQNQSANVYFSVIQAPPQIYCPPHAICYDK